ncbi:hypothetical protein [Anaeromicropila populeti]|uniref:Uncharacterized protein n=1 Tax=Anaeromicropila populeti TaxID=37658 RepID=A0A1I6JYU9_9FIRM|nr:hypothetical protein [Anaeromicropila populeti]SFR83720.1 hypothetical protein SAMN05661086_02054 [Anaeromicropila populeti]
MGEMYNANCSCGLDMTFSIGEGLNAHNRNFINKLLKKQDVETFNEAYESGFVKLFKVENVPYLCEDCKRFGTTFRFTYELHSGETIQLVGKCSMCNKPVRILTKDTMLCPRCGQKINMEEVGHWD